MTSKTTLFGVATILAIGAAGIAATQASAQGRGERPTPPSFTELDVDGNGSINRADIAAFAAAKFAEADTDGNGSLSAAELTARAVAEAETRGAQMSTRMINRMDSNGDGELSQDEMSAGRGGRGGDMAGRMLERADTDNDGAVSQAEYDAAVAKMGERDGKGKGHGKGRGQDRGNDRGHDRQRGGN